ncbi:hypothetical protein JCM10207_007038 [Rhodosporidiobolus poonsookiae]
MLVRTLMKRIRPPAASFSPRSWLLAPSHSQPPQPSLASSTPVAHSVLRRSYATDASGPRRRGRPPKEVEAPPVDAVEAPDAEEPPLGERQPQGIRLRPYQAECIRAVLDELDRGQFQRLGVSAPTGSGKTAIFTSLIHYLPPLVHPTTGEQANRVLIVVNSIQLALQTAEVVRRTYPNLSVEVEQGVKKASGMADVTVATYQTLARGELSRLDKFDPDYLKAVIVDEAHHAIAHSYLAILSRFDSHIISSPESGSKDRLMAADNSIPAAVPISPNPSAPARTSALEPTEEEDADETLEPSTMADFADLASTPLPPEPLSDDPDPAEILPAPIPRPMVFDEQGRPRVPLLAFTATWGRADGLALGKVWERIVWHSGWLEMIEGAWLSPLRFTTVHLGDELDMARVDVSSSGDFNIASLAHAVDTAEVNRLAVDAWEAKAGDRRSTLVFAVSVAHVVSLTNEFRERGVDARFVYADTKQAQREELYRAFKAGEFPVLVNCGILTEGADFPVIDCVLLARPTRSQNLFLQMLGRGLRLSPDSGKEDCLVIDLVGNSASSGGVVCTPTLFGLDPNDPIEGQTTTDLQERGLERALSQPETAESTDPIAKLQPSTYVKRHTLHYRDYETAFDFVQQQRKKGEEVYIPVSRLSRLAWVGCGENVWVLELMGHGHVKVVKEDETFTSYLYTKIPFAGPGGARYSAPRHIASHPTLAILFRTTDAFITHDDDFSALSLGRHAPWRRSEASEAQKRYVLKKLGKDADGPEGQTIEGVWVGRPWTDRVEVASLTKGQASDIIARTINGGLGAWRDARKGLVKERKRADKEREKNERTLEMLRARGERREAREQEKVEKRLAKIRGISLDSKAAE